MKLKDRLAEQITDVSDSLGVQLSLAELHGSRDFDYEIRIVGIDRPYGFSLLLGVDYLTWVFALDLDEYGTSALEAMRIRFDSRRELLSSFVKIASERNKALRLELNGQELHNWQTNAPWTDFELNVRQTYSSEENSYEAFRTSLLDILCIVLSLLVEEEVWGPGDNSEPDLGHVEGANSLAIVSKYERSRYNRALCLRYYGFRCRGCGIHMEAKYGPIGQNVIHVHHVVPVSQMGGSYRLDPIRDLIPLCPNCHNVVHRMSPPMKISQLNAQTGFVAE